MNKKTTKKSVPNKNGTAQRTGKSASVKDTSVTNPSGGGIPTLPDKPNTPSLPRKTGAPESLSDAGKPMQPHEDSKPATLPKPKVSSKGRTVGKPSKPLKLHKPSHLTKATAIKQVQERVTMPCRITIRFTEEQMKAVLEAARIKGYKPSAYCRLVLLGRKVVDVSPETKKFRQTLVNGGNNLNQIAKHMNEAGASKKDFDDLHALIDWFKRLKAAIN